MANFCRQCGAKNHMNAKFCEACGCPMPAPASHGHGQTSRPAASPSRRKNLIALAITSVIVLLITGGILAYMLAPEAPTPENLAKPITAYLRENPEIREEQICLSNMNYGENPVRINGWNERANRWMEFLVENGIYKEPQVISAGMFAPPQNAYFQTEVGQQRIRGNRLCFADDIVVTVTGVQPLDLENKIKFPVVRVKFKLTHVNPAEWTRNELARQLFPYVFGDNEHEINMWRQEGKWHIMEDL